MKNQQERRRVAFAPRLQSRSNLDLCERMLEEEDGDENINSSNTVVCERSISLDNRALEQEENLDGHKITKRNYSTDLPATEYGLDKPVMNRRTLSDRHLEAGTGGYVFAGSLSPLLRQWSKFATAISSMKDRPVEADDSDGREPTSEDVFLKRFSNRYLAFSMSVENGNAPGAMACSEDDETKKDNKWFGSCNFIVSPDSGFIFYWLSMVTICILYNWWTLIVRQCFTELSTGDTAGIWFILDACADSIFVLDLVIQLRTGYLEQGLLVVDGKKLARRYFWSTLFLLDSFSLTPLDYMPSSYNPLLRFPRLLKTYRAVKLYYMLESRTVYPNVIRVANWCHILLLACHWFACFHFMVAGMDGFGSHWTEWNSGNVNNTSLTRKYLLSLYWSTLTLTTIGTTTTPVTEWEYLFTILSYLIGVFVFAAIVGQVGNVITNRNARRLEFERLSDGAKQYMRYHKVPKVMQKRVQQWFDYSWSRGKMAGSTDTEALSVLPDKLKTELALRVNLDTLRKVTMFQECQPQFLHDLVLKMRAVIFTPGDIVCRKGEVAREMYIIADGVLEVLNEHGETIRLMRSGDFFGEIGVLNLDSGLNKRTADVRSIGYSELFCLSKEDILAATRDYPEAESILREHGQRRLQHTLQSQCSNDSVVSESWSRPQSALGKTDQSSSAINRSYTSVSSLALTYKRSMKSNHSDKHHLVCPMISQRHRSSSLADAVVSISRHVAAPSRVTNLLGCPVKEEKSRQDETFFEPASSTEPVSNSYLDVQRHHRRKSIEFAQMERRNVESRYSCNEEIAGLKNAMHKVVCPQLYVNVIYALHKAQHTINSKFHVLSDLLTKSEIEASTLRQEISRLMQCHDPTTALSRPRSGTLE